MLFTWRYFSGFCITLLYSILKLYLETRGFVLHAWLCMFCLWDWHLCNAESTKRIRERNAPDGGSTSTFDDNWQLVTVPVWQVGLLHLSWNPRCIQRQGNACCCLITPAWHPCWKSLACLVRLTDSRLSWHFAVGDDEIRSAPHTILHHNKRKLYMSARQNLRPLGTVSPGHWYLILSWNSHER